MILDITPKGTAAFFLSVDAERNLSFEKMKRNVDLEKFLKSPARKLAQKHWEGEHLFKTRRKFVAAVDSALATTIPIPVVLQREKSLHETPITIPELENAIAQEMGKIFNTCRSEAAGRLHADELDTVLVGARVRHFRIDGNAIVNPEGFVGKKIELLLELTFTTRDLFEMFKPFFNSPDAFFFAESPQARLASLARVRKLPVNLIVAGEQGSSLFVLDAARGKYPVLYRESLLWDFASLLRRIEAEFSVTDVVAKNLYDAYCNGRMSPSAARAFKKIIDPVFEAFFKEIEKKKIKGFVYLDAPYDLPVQFPYKRHGIVFERFPITEMLQELGFAGTDSEAPASSRHLLPFFEAYFDNRNEDINRKLRRRLHWLLE